MISRVRFDSGLGACRLAVVLCLLAAPGTHAAELKIATWNLNWLTQRQAGLPGDVKIRQPEDFDRLRAYAVELNADVIAIEEVDNAETARLVFSPEVYSIHMSGDRVRQRVGIVVRRGLPYDVNPDVTGIALDPAAHLRSGVDVTLHPPLGHSELGPLRVLAVHLKQGCQYLVFGKSPNSTCLTLMSQFDVVAQWIAARRGEGIAFLVLGDFNRGLDKNDPFSRTLDPGSAMTRVTGGYSSPCWGHESFIDHILIGGSARGWVKPNSMRVLAYRETDPAWKERLSDHCPVSVRLVVAD
jgi:endonuclease/exonuclease/phosphatase family metal-dependent hydrolase